MTLLFSVMLNIVLEHQSDVALALLFWLVRAVFGRQKLLHIRRNYRRREVGVYRLVLEEHFDSSEFLGMSLPEMIECRGGELQPSEEARHIWQTLGVRGKTKDDVVFS